MDFEPSSQDNFAMEQSLSYPKSHLAAMTAAFNKIADIDACIKQLEADQESLFTAWREEMISSKDYELESDYLFYEITCQKLLRARAKRKLERGGRPDPLAQRFARYLIGYRD